MGKIKVGDWTNQGRVLFIDNVSEKIPDPICKVSSTMACTARLSELVLEDEPQSEIDARMEKIEKEKQRKELLKQLRELEE
jgi:hypothetical protein